MATDIKTQEVLFMNKFNNATLYSRINEAIKDAERLLHIDSKMMSDIKKKNDWKYDTDNGEEVAKQLWQTTVWDLITVQTYKPLNPWTKAIGYYDGSKIHINLRKLPALSHVDLVGLLCHEWAHHKGFTHGNNYKTKEKCLYSVPYYLSENVSKWL